MKVAILSESEADEAAVQILVEAVLGQAVEPITRFPRPGGWAPVLKALPRVLKNLHYRRSAEALVVVLDSNSSPIHDAGPDEDCSSPDRCRLCVVRRSLASVAANLPPVGSYEPIKLAVGIR